MDHTVRFPVERSFKSDAPPEKNSDKPLDQFATENARRFQKEGKSFIVNSHRTWVSPNHDPASFPPWGPRPATRKMSAVGQFHQISIDEFTLLRDVASFGFRPKPIGKAAIVSGCHHRFK
jgi:hypothetical protein